MPTSIPHQSKGRLVRFLGASIAAAEFGVSRGHRHRVLTGDRESATLLARWRGWLKRHPAISERDILKFPIPKIAAKIAQQIISQIRQAHIACQEAQALLEKAKRAVEVAIEEGEEKGLTFLKSP